MPFDRAGPNPVCVSEFNSIQRFSFKNEWGAIHTERSVILDLPVPPCKHFCEEASFYGLGSWFAGGQEVMEDLQGCVVPSPRGRPVPISDLQYFETGSAGMQKIIECRAS